MISGNVGGDRTGRAMTTGCGVVSCGGSARVLRRMTGGWLAAILTAAPMTSGAGVTSAGGGCGPELMTAACGRPHGVSAVAMTTTGAGVPAAGGTASASEERDSTGGCAATGAGRGVTTTGGGVVRTGAAASEGRPT